MDELIELFSVMNQLEKGALGLFFEMNYFIGIILSIYITWFSNKFEIPTATNPDDQKNFDNMFMWLNIQYIYIYVSIFISMIVFCVYKNMNNKAVGKGIERKDEKKKLEQSNKEQDMANADVEMTKFKPRINWTY